MRLIMAEEKDTRKKTATASKKGTAKKNYNS